MAATICAMTTSQDMGRERFGSFPWQVLCTAVKSPAVGLAALISLCLALIF